MEVQSGHRRDAAPYSGAERLHRSSLRNTAGHIPLPTTVLFWYLPIFDSWVPRWRLVVGAGALPDVFRELGGHRAVSCQHGEHAMLPVEGRDALIGVYEVYRHYFRFARSY
jgi:hypothetical protein